jgi:tetratricopeptide (TPR) repeat protein
MYQQALTINKGLGRQEGIAVNYGNLGIVYQTRGDLEEAEEMFHKSLSINKALGRKDGIANQYSNLGKLSEIQNDPGRAVEMYQNSLDLFVELKSPEAEKVAELLRQLRKDD